MNSATSDGFGADADVASALKGLDVLNGDLRVHLARSMAVAGGEVFRDEAKARAPVGGDLAVAAHQHGESNNPGTLKRAIYLAYKTELSSRAEAVYTVTWNKKVAPHGHLVEFGHWQTRKAYVGSDGYWYSTKEPLAQPRWIAANPFLRPAYDAALPRARAAMIARGRERLPELLNNGYDPGSDSQHRAE